MGAFTLTDVQLLVGAFELGAFSGSFETGGETDMKEVPNFAARGYMVKTPGAFTATGSVTGYADYATGAVGQSFKVAQIGSQQAFTVIPTGSVAAIGDPAVFMRGKLAAQKMLMGAANDVAGFNLAIEGDSAEVDGILLAPLASRGAVTGAQVSIPAVLATQQVFGVVHVTAAVGTNLTWKIQSTTTADSGFASPVDRITFATVSAVGWQFIALPGPFTDTRWRAVATVGGSTFVSAVAFGVL